MELNPWKILKSTMVFDGGWMTLRRERCLTNTGQELDPYYVIDFRGWAMIVPVTPDGGIVALRHYRHAIRKVSWEFPSGAMEAGETPEQAGARELVEETGYTSDDIQLIGRVAPNPALQSNWMNVLLARSVKKTAEPNLEIGEDLEVTILDTDEMAEMIVTGELYHALNIAAFHLALSKGHIK